MILYALKPAPGLESAPVTPLASKPGKILFYPIASGRPPGAGSPNFEPEKLAAANKFILVPPQLKQYLRTLRIHHPWNPI